VSTSASPVRWLWLPLFVAAISLAMAMIDLLGAVVAFARGERLTFGSLAFPCLILLLSALTLCLGIPRLRSFAERQPPPSWLRYPALVFGAAVAVLFGAEIAYAVAKEGVVVLLDFPIVMVFVLGVSCSAVALA
jgi:hypothetical protein